MEKYVKIVFTVTDDNGEGYELTVFKATKPQIDARDDDYDLRNGLGDLVRSIPLLIDFELTFRGYPDHMIDGPNIYVMKKLPRPEGEES